MDGFVDAHQRARTLQASMGVISEMRADNKYGRLPPKVIGAIESKFAERHKNLETFNDTSTVLQTAITQFDSLVQQIPPEMEYDVLRSLLASFDQLAAVLPKWVGAEYAAYRSLLLMRIGLYDEYQKIAGIAAAGSRPHLEAVEYRSAVEDANLRRASRVSSLMGDKDVILSLREAKSSIDTAFPQVLLDAKGVPVEYRVCYRAVGDKLAAMLCGKLGVSMRPAMPSDPIVESSSVSGINVTHDILQLRFGLEKAYHSGFSTFARFVRHKRADWSPTEPAQAAAEIYAAVLATTLTREYGATWHRIRFMASSGLFVASPDSVCDTQGGRGKKSNNIVHLTLSDVVLSAMLRNSMHLVNFMRLDLTRQHEYMARTITPVLTKSLLSDILINTLVPTDTSTQWRSLPLAGDLEDLAQGMLFSIRMSDWKQNSFSTTSLLDVWMRSPGESGRAAAAKIASAIPGNPLATFTVLARMCIPPNALASLWEALQPEAFSQQNLSYDDVVTSRLDIASTVQTSVAVDPEMKSVDTKSRKQLYTTTGTSTTFTLAGSAPSAVKEVSALDVATCALMFGAPVVIAMETPEMFSEASGMSFCLKIFDSRPGATDHEIIQAVSSDLSSWGTSLLALDPNAIENACLTTQLEILSGLVASKLLAPAPPCLIVLDPSMRVIKVLWESESPRMI